MIALIAWRNIWRNKKRSLLSMISITVTTIAVLFLFSFLSGIQTDLKDNVVRYITGSVRVRTIKYDENEHLNPLPYYISDIPAVIQAIEKVPGVEGLSARSTFPALGKLGDEEYQMILEAIDPIQDAKFRDLASYLLVGEFFGSLAAAADGRPRYPAVATAGLARSVGLAVGDQVTILTQTAFQSINAMTFYVQGIVSLPLSSVNQTTLFVPLELGQRLIKTPQGATEILIRASSSADIDLLAQDISTELGNINLDIRPWTKISQTYNLLQAASIFYTIIGLMFFLLGSVAIINTTIMMVYERKREIGMMMALGMQNREIRVLFFLESLFMSIMAAVLGLILGGILVFFFSYVGIDISSQMQGVEMDISGLLYTVPRIRNFILVAIFSVGVAAIASFFPTRRATKLHPVEALRIET